MIFQPREYLLPTSVEDAINLLEKFGERAAIISGGVTLYEIAKKGLISHVDTLIDISRLGLNRFGVKDGSFYIQPMVTFSELSKAREIGMNCYAAFGDCLHKFVPWQVRNLATVGGSLCSALPFLDVPTILLALDAKLEVSGPNNSKRILPLTKFYRGFLETDLKAAEMLTNVIVPLPKEKSGSAFKNHKRTAVDIPVLNVAVSVTLGPDGSCEWLALAMGGIAETPVRIASVEHALLGKKLTREEISHACEVLSDLEPIDSIHAGPEYKRVIAKLLAEDLILRATERAGGLT